MIDPTCGPRNTHSFKPKTCSEYVCFCISYVSPCFIFVLIAALSVLYNVFFIKICVDNNHGWRLAVGIILLLIGDFFIAFLLWSYYAVIFTPVGYVSSDPWVHPPRYAGNHPGFNPRDAARSSDDAEQGQHTLNPYTVRDLDRKKRLRFCEICRQYKPDKAYHCHACQRCTYRFDHHCPVVNNCIGRDTHKLFVTFLLYVTVAGIIDGGLMLIGIFLIDAASSEWWMLWVIPPVLMIVFGLSLCVFGGVHAYLIYRGETTMSRHIASANEDNRGPLLRLFNPRAETETSVHRKQRLEQVNFERKRNREESWNDVLGTDRTWWRVILPLKPKRAATMSEEQTEITV